MTTKFARAALAAELAPGDKPPREIELLPAGTIETRPHDGRAAWHNPDAAAVVAATAELALDLPVDYEHQGERAMQNGQPAPAAGWIKRVFERAGAVWGEVEWTERAAAMIKAREYRFISPTFVYDRASRVVQRLVSAALVNDPAFYMRAIARSDMPESSTQLEDPMDLKKLLAALGLAETATEADALAAAKAAAGAVAKLRTALGLGDDADGEALATAVTALRSGLQSIAKAAGLAEDAAVKDVETAVASARSSGAGDDPDPAKFVPRAEFDRVTARVDELEGDRHTAAVDDAIKAGKVAPAQRDWALAYARKDPSGFADYIKAAPAILPNGRVAPTGDPSSDGDKLTAEERATCRALRISEEEFIKSRKALRAARNEEG